MASSGRWLAIIFVIKRSTALIWLFRVNDTVMLRYSQAGIGLSEKINFIALPDYVIKKAREWVSAS